MLQFKHHLEQREIRYLSVEAVMALVGSESIPIRQT
jgi:hypothetical protein